MHEGGGNCVIYLKRGWNRKKGMANKHLKREGGEGQAGSRGGCLKKGALETPYKLCLSNIHKDGLNQLENS